MSARIRSFVKDLSVFSMQPILDKVIALFLVPMYTAYLTTSEYGVVSYVETIILILASVTTLGLGPAFWRFINKEGIDNRSVYTSVAINQSIAGFLVIIVLMIPLAMSGIIRSPKLVLLYAFARVLNFPFSIVRAHLRIQHKASLYLILSVTTAVIRLVMTIVFVVALSASSSGVIYGRAIPLVIAGIYGIYFLIKKIGYKYSVTVSKEMIKFGTPLAVSTLIALLLTAMDKLAIEHIRGSAELGLYAYANTFAMILTGLIFTPFFMAWVPHMWEIFRSKNSRFTFAYVARIVFLVSLIAGLLFPGVAIPLAVGLARSKEFLAGIYLIPILASAQIMRNIYKFEDMGFYFSNKTAYITILTAIAAVTNLILNFLLIPNYGFAGAAVATLFSFTLLRCLGFFFSLKFYPYDRAKKTEIILLVLYMAATIACSIIIYKGYSILVIISFSILSGLLLVFTAFQLHYVSANDFRKFTSLIKSGKKKGKTQ